MKLALYYALHSIKNQIKKLFKTWVAVFILVCFAFGIIVGLGATAIENIAGSDVDTSQSEQTEEIVDEPIDPLTPEEVAVVVEFIAGAIVLVVFTISALTGDKSGSKIFLPADVNLLFAAPKKPQSVLLFRLVMQMGALAAVSIYLVFQVLNIGSEMGLGVINSLGILLAWFLTLIYGQLISVLVYTAASTCERLKNLVRPIIFGLLGVLGASFYLYYKNSGIGLLASLNTFFNAPFTRYIPVWGWLKGFTVSLISGNAFSSALFFVLLLLGIVVFAALVWRIRADFYEDAMHKTDGAAAAAAAAAQSGGIAVVRKKERSERVKRDGLERGNGASIYFHKAMYNRKRFAVLVVFTKTSLTYLATALLVSLALKFIIGYENLIIVALVLGGFVFFRSLGNPIAQDVNMASFMMVPESAYKKVFYSLLGGTVNCALDLLPAILVSVVLLRANPVSALLYLLFIVSVDFYSSNAGAFIDLSIPTSLDKNIRAMLQIMFIYFGLLPIAAVILIGYLLGQSMLFVLISAVINVLIGLMLSCFTPKFIEHGRK